MDMELEEKLYDLIKKDDIKETFLKNIDLFKEFYKDRHLYFLTKFNDEKVFEIFKFMLKNESGEIFEYFHAEILKNIKLLKKVLITLIKNIVNLLKLKDLQIQKHYKKLVTMVESL